MKFSSTFPTVFFGVAASISIPFHGVLALSPQEVGTIAQSVTVRIDGQSSGSGVLIEKNGNTYTVLTAAHVVAAKENYSLQTSDEQRYPLDLQRVEKLPNVDLALVEFESNQNYSVVEMGDATEAKSGTSIFVAGFPAPTQAITDRVFNFTDGKITANATRPLDNGYALAYSNNALPGMSGGAVLNEQGHLIGIHGRADTAQETRLTDTIYQKTGFNLGIPINTFLALTQGTPPSSTQATALTADDWFLQAGYALQKQNYRIAIGAFDQAIQLNPYFGFAYSNRGVARSNIGDTKGAIDDFSKAIQQNPGDAIAYSNRGYARKNLDDLQGAIADYSKAIQLDPNYATAYYNRGAARSDINDSAGAIADYNKAIQLNPKFAEAYYNRGVIRREQGNAQGAIADFNQAIQVNPSYSIAYSNRGATRNQLGDKKGAIADYNKAIQLNPKFAEAYYNRGVLRGPLGDIQGAITDLNKAIQLKPDYAAAYTNRGIARSQLGDTKGELADYEKSIQLDPDYALAYYNRGYARSQLGNKKGAIADYTVAARLFKAQGQTRYYQTTLQQLQQLSR